MPSSRQIHPSRRPRAVVRTVAELRARRSPACARPAGAIAVVPTMGAFHEGHLALMRRAGEDGHAVVVTLFVNPTQFAADRGPLALPARRGPRPRARGRARASTWSSPRARTRSTRRASPPRSRSPGRAPGLEGAARPEHFDGVATVVAKLLLAVRPDRAVFGQKDAQQVAVVRRLMADLHLDDIELVVGPIVREPDGLAMSSRNAYLDAEDRRAATALTARLRGRRGARAARASATPPASRRPPAP